MPKSKKNISLRWKIGLYLSVFSFVLVAIVFIFQAVLLEPMYEASKKRTVENVSNAVVNVVKEEDDADDIEQYINIVQETNETCIRVLRESNIFPGTYEDTYFESDSGNLGCRLYKMSSNEILTQIANAENSGKGESMVVQDTNLITPTNGERFRNITYTRIINDHDGNKSIVMVYSNITPISTTKKTLSMQMWYILVIILLAVLVLTYIMYRTIARPLILINQSAKSLPEGKYERVTVQNYREAEELNDTLLTAAGCNYFMGIPAGDDIMLNYQTTGYHDNQSLRELFGKQPIKEFKEWLVKYGFMTEDGKLTEKAGDPSVFLK